MGNENKPGATMDEKMERASRKGEEAAAWEVKRIKMQGMKYEILY